MHTGCSIQTDVPFLLEQGMMTNHNLCSVLYRNRLMELFSVKSASFSCVYFKKIIKEMSGPLSLLAPV